jgi:hypothetical protein
VAIRPANSWNRESTLVGRPVLCNTVSRERNNVLKPLPVQTLFDSLHTCLLGCPSGPGHSSCTGRRKCTAIRNLHTPDRAGNPAVHAPVTDRTSGQYTHQTAITILDVSGAHHNKYTPCIATARSAFPPVERAFFMSETGTAAANRLSRDFSQNRSGNARGVAAAFSACSS